MASQARGGARGVERRSKLIMALLLLMVALTGVLTYQAQDAARSHRATVERALRDFASIAVAWLDRNAQEALYSVLIMRMDSIHAQLPTVAGVPESQLPGRAALEHCNCFGDKHSFTRFVLAGEKQTLISEEPLPDAARAWILDSLDARSGATAYRTWRVGLAFPGSGRQAVGYAQRDVAGGQPQAIVGFVSDAYDLAPLFAKMLDVYPTLPKSLLRGARSDSLISVEVLTASGLTIYHTPHVYPPAFSALDTLPPKFGDLRLRLALRPEAADLLVIGGLPRTRLPLLLGLLALTLALCVVAVQQLRRETELARMREDFVSSVSHELRTPLAQIRMFTETLLLGRTRSDAERRRSLEIIDQEARRLSHLVENVLRISRAARGVSRVAPENVDLTAEVIANVESFRLFAAQRKVELRPELQAGVMGVVDRGGLRQMLVNLLDNALKYGPAGQRVTVGLALFEESARIWVDDEGQGIAAEDREKVFMPFYRSPRDAGSAVAGSGIGLAVVREIATLHGGRAWAEAAPGGGARVCIEIPGAYVRQPAAEGDWVAAKTA